MNKFYEALINTLIITFAIALAVFPIMMSSSTDLWWLWIIFYFVYIFVLELIICYSDEDK